MGRLFSGSILPNYWKLLRVKINLKHMMHFFNAYNVDSSCNYGPVGRMGIVGIAAIIDGKISDFSFKTLLGWWKVIIGAQEPTNAH